METLAELWNCVGAIYSERGKGNDFMRSIMSLRIIIGVLLGITILQCSQTRMVYSTIPYVAYVLLWSIGTVYVTPYYLRKIDRKLTSLLKLSIIAYLTVGRNAIAIIVLLVSLLIFISTGWVIGWIMLISEIIHA